jgi:DNA-binding NtrC family response regulator
MSEARILVVDDNKDMRWLVSNLLKAEGYAVDVADSGVTALDRIRHSAPEVVLLDLRMPKMAGWQALEQIKKIGEPISVIIMTAYGDVKAAVRAMKMGAYDFLTKPFDNEEVILTVRRAVENVSLRKEMQSLKKKLKGEQLLENVMGTSQEIKRVIHKLHQVAPTSMSVVIQGETGTGKELIAHTIHERSARSERPFIAVDCGAIPETLMESEFFGHEKGAFTGAEGRRIGYFESAEGGTLFLDEISNLPLFLQGKLLRVLQEREVSRLGSYKSMKVDVRVLASTNRPLDQEVKAGKFREDLYYRLSEFTISLPRLKDRKDDILFLARVFLNEANSELNKATTGFSPEAVRAITHYDWPGNVRELRSAIRRAVLFDSKMITTEHLFESGPDGVPEKGYECEEGDAPSLRAIAKRTLREAEVEAIEKALRTAGGNKSKAAELLQVDYKTLFRKIKRYNISDFVL